MKPSILITGAAGYLGRSLIRQLNARGIRPMGVDFRSLPKELLSDCRFQRLNLSNANACRTLFAAWKPSHVVHAAAFVKVVPGMPGTEKDSLFSANVLTTRTILDASLAQRVRSFIFLSSMCVYASSPKSKVSESNPVGPISYYGLTKAIAEKIVHAYGTWSSMKTIVLRPTGLFGEDRRSGFIFQWMQKALTNRTIEVPRGLSIPWNILSVTELSKLIVRLLLAKKSLNGITLNVGNSHPIRFPELAKQIIRCTGSHSSLKFTGRGKDIPFAYDPDLLKKKTGWLPKPLPLQLQDYAKILKEESSS